MRDLMILKGEFDKEKREIDMSHTMEKRELTDMIETFDEETKERLDMLKDQYNAE